MRQSFVALAAALVICPAEVGAETLPPAPAAAPSASSSGKLPPPPAAAPNAGLAPAPTPSATGAAPSATGAAPSPYAAPTAVSPNDTGAAAQVSEVEATPEAPASQPGQSAPRSYGEPIPTEPDPSPNGLDDASGAFNEPGRVVLSFEHLAGLFSQTLTAEVTTTLGFDDTIRGESEIKLFTVGLLGSSGGVYSTPQLGLDVFLNRSVTLGAALSFYSSTVETEDEESKATGFNFSPRVGAVFGKKHLLGWIRGGLAISNGTEEIPGIETLEVDTSSQALTLEALLVILHKKDNFGVSVGPAVYIPLGASTDINGEEVDDVDLSISTWMFTLSGHLGL